MKWNLLEKTSFWVEGIELSNVNLEHLSKEAALALELESHEIMVVDVRPNLVAFDILRREIKAEAIVGKEKDLLKRLGSIEGVYVKPDAKVHSEGILGLIALGEEEADDFISRAAELASEVVKQVSLRALVFASGTELILGKIQDLNSPYIIGFLSNLGFKAEFGGILADDVYSVVNRLDEALGKGYGLIIITGGVGAEDKDCNIEAILQLDPKAHTPWILKFEPDYRRHHKEGVRIAVGRVGLARLIALPGPHEEVKIACEVLEKYLLRDVDDFTMAQEIAKAIRSHWQAKTKKGAEVHGS
ncbi:MAG: molybdopterin-binding protein [Synergistetes bacterium]|nr:molybdopterin-binding protein [Synergistota bacterium]MDW8191986.1 molybdopterin-binding protein [Synergistota bacterium]